VYRLPEGFDLDVAAMCEPFCCIIHAFQKASPGYGDTVLISGPGPMGLMAVMMARFAGCGTIIVTGLSSDRERLRAAQGLGAVTINVQAENVLEAVKDLTEGMGVDIAFDTSGSSKAVTGDVDLLKKGGKLMVVGLATEPADFLPVAFALGEKEIIGIRAYSPSTWETCLRVLASGKIDLTPLISHRLPMAEAEKGFQLIEHAGGKKILLKPTS
jgi:threonine dehydrogenase-like Zn-dependent dehydrogenase